MDGAELPRGPRLVVPGLAHHITQRGNRGLDVFTAKSEMTHYLECLTRYGEARGVKVIAYCLMPNHVHVVAVPELPLSLALAFRDAHTAYSTYFNLRHGETGHLWQNRFFSCPLDEGHLHAAVRYVEMNPVRARIVSEPGDYEWSSAPAHLGIAPAHELLSDLPGSLPGPGEWREFLASYVWEDEQVVRIATRSGKHSRIAAEEWKNVNSRMRKTRYLH